MRTFPILLALTLSLCLSTACAQTPAPPAPSKVALVIGNDAYTAHEMALRAAVGDSTAVAKLLTTLVFTVIHVADSNLRRMGESVSQFQTQLQLWS